MKKILTGLLFFTIAYQTLIADQIPVQNDFTKGYIFSKLEDMFPNEKIEFEIQDNQIIIYKFPSNVNSCQNIQQYLESFQNYDIVFDGSYEPSASYFYNEPQLGPTAIAEEGDWLPELSPFFPTLLAQSHIIGYSAGYRSYDKIFKTNCLPVSIGDQFSLYQFKTRLSGRVYFGIEACVWAIFEGRTKSLSLLNADYYVAFPITYINNNFSARLRVYHESSHLGDEFLLEHPRIKRFNPSMEVVDLAFAYEFPNGLTPFIGYSRVLRSDDNFRIKPNNVYYGFNYFLNFCKLKICNLEATPYIATYFNNLEDNNWKFNSSVAIGFQWDKTYGHKFRIYVKAHDGFSEEGQFSKQRTQYITFKILYGY